MAKEDIRITKTKRDLRNGLVSLLKERQFEKITVCDICETAMINRMTFYKHYGDKHDLLKDVFDYAQSKFNSLEVDVSAVVNDTNGFLNETLGKILDDCEANADLLNSLSRHDGVLVKGMIFNSLNAFFTKICTRYAQAYPCKGSLPMIACFLAGGLERIISALLEGAVPSLAEVKNESKQFILTVLSSDAFFAQG